MRTGLALALALALSAPAHGQVMEMKEVKEVGGRSLDEWIKDIANKDPGKRDSAIRAVLVFGPEKAYEAVPAMLAELRRHTGSTTIDLSVRVNICISLGAIFGSKKDCDPKYVKEAVTLLSRLVRDENQAVVKYRAAQALGSIGAPDARPAALLMLPLMRDQSNYEMRQTGALVLAKLGTDRNSPPAPVIYENYRPLLTDPASQVRLAACQSLSILGPPADDKQKAIMLKVLEPVAKKDVDSSVQVWANLTIMGYYGKFGGEHLDGITRILQKSDVAAKIQAAQALGMAGKLANEAWPSLVRSLGDTDPSVVGWSIWALGKVEARKALPALEKIAANPKLALPSLDKMEPMQLETLKKAAKDSVQQIEKALTGAK